MYKSILIKNGRIFDGEKFFAGDVLVENGRIAQLGTVSATDAYFIFDATGMTVCPGLVDIHAHMAGITEETYAAPPESTLFPFGVTAAIASTLFASFLNTDFLRRPFGIFLLAAAVSLLRDTKSA